MTAQGQNRRLREALSQVCFSAVSRHCQSASARRICAAQADYLASLNCTVCAKERQGWDGQTQRVRGFEIDDERKSRGLLDRNITGLCSFQNPIDERCHLTKSAAQARSIRDQTAFIRRFWPLIHRRQPEFR